MSLSSPDSIFGPALAPEASFAQRQEYRRALGLPRLVDRWLTSNLRSTRIAFLKDYLMLIDENGADCVICSVECVRSKVCAYCICNMCLAISYLRLRVQTPANAANFAQPDVWTLYVTATAPSRTGSGQAAIVSPRAILERYVGSKEAIDAPEWTQWTCAIEEFQQPRASFGVLFTRMAFWKVNRDYVSPFSCLPNATPVYSQPFQPQLALDMVKWARRISVSVQL